MIIDNFTVSGGCLRRKSGTSSNSCDNNIVVLFDDVGSSTSASASLSTNNVSCGSSFGSPTTSVASLPSPQSSSPLLSSPETLWLGDTPASFKPRSPLSGIKHGRTEYQGKNILVNSSLISLQSPLLTTTKGGGDHQPEPALKRRRVSLDYLHSSPTSPTTAHHNYSLEPIPFNKSTGATGKEQPSPIHRALDSFGFTSSNKGCAPMQPRPALPRFFHGASDIQEINSKIVSMSDTLTPQKKQQSVNTHPTAKSSNNNKKKHNKRDEGNNNVQKKKTEQRKKDQDFTVKKNQGTRRIPCSIKTRPAAQRDTFPLNALVTPTANNTDKMAQHFAASSQHHFGMNHILENVLFTNEHNVSGNDMMEALDLLSA